MNMNRGIHLKLAAKLSNVWGPPLSVEELAVISDDLWELSAAVHYMQQSSRLIKILTVPTEHVHKTAAVFRRVGIQGVVRDSMGLIVIPVSTVD